MEPLWGFSAAVPEARRRELLSVSGLPEVLTRIAAGAVVSFSVEPRDNPPCLGTHRAIFRLRVGASDYDAFFNSPVGYRAQYCMGLEQGRRCNRQLIAALTPNCLAFAKGKEPSNFPERLVAASLAGGGAKIWIDENDLADLEGPHIEYPPWLAKAATVATGSFADMAARSKAEAGILAPVGTHLELKGGWIRPDGTECHDPAKEHRSQEIHDYGFS